MPKFVELFTDQTEIHIFDDIETDAVNFIKWAMDKVKDELMANVKLIKCYRLEEARLPTKWWHVHELQSWCMCGFTLRENSKREKEVDRRNLNQRKLFQKKEFSHIYHSHRTWLFCILIINN